MRLAGRTISSRGELAAAVIDAHDAVAAGVPGVFRPGSRSAVPYWGGEQQHENGDALAVAVWARESGADPFTDDVPRWAVTCAALSVDRGRAALEADLVRCPDEVTGSSPPDPEVRPRPLPVEAPAVGRIVTGAPAATGEPDAPLLFAGPPGQTFPCAAEDLRATLEAVSTSVGGTDQARLRVVNSGSRPCALPRATGLSLSRDGRPQQVRTDSSSRPGPALAPMESATARVSWRPGRAPDAFPSQRVAVVFSGSEVQVGLAAGLPAVPLPVDDDATVSLSEWARLGYGATLDDARPSVDVAPECRGGDLMARTPDLTRSGSSATPAPQVDVTNIGTATCRMTPGTPGSGVPGLPRLVEAAVVVLRPGDTAALLTHTAVSHRPAQALVAGRWVHVARPSIGP